MLRIPRTLQRAREIPPKLPLRTGGPGHPDGSLDPPKSIAQTASWLVQPFQHSSHLWLPDRLLLLLDPFDGLFSRTTWVSWNQKGKTSLDLNEARDDRVLGWQWHQLGHMQTICTSLQTDNHTNTSTLNFYRPRALPEAQPRNRPHLMLCIVKRPNKKIFTNSWNRPVQITCDWKPDGNK